MCVRCGKLSKEEKSIFYKKCRILKKYAANFCDTVRNEFNDTLNIKLTLDYPVCCFVSYMRQLEGEELTGNYYEDRIIISDILGTDIEELKRIVKHECLHFLLAKSGYPYGDFDEMFLMAALHYDANPYGLYKNNKLREELAIFLKQKTIKLSNYNGGRPMTDNERNAERLINAIKRLAEDPAALENLKSYLTYHFDTWQEKYANTPDGLAAELESFSNIN